jgi:hypothetical protein
MEAFDSTCVLWLPQAEAAHVSGIIRFDRKTGITVDAIGSFDPDEPVAYLVATPTDDDIANLDVATSADTTKPPKDQTLPIVLGVIPGAEITLLNVARSQLNDSLPGHAQEHLSPSILIRGAHLPDGMDTEIRTLSVRFDALDDWYDTAVLGENLWTTETESSKRTISWQTHPSYESTLEDGTVITLTAPAAVRHGLRDASINTEPRFTVTYGEPVSITAVLTSVRTLRWLTSLMTRTPARVTKVHAAADEQPPFEIVFQSPEPSIPRRRSHPYAIVAKLPDFDFTTSVRRWVAMQDKLNVPMALLFGNWFSTSLYTENRFLNAITAAEALASQIFPSDRTPLEARPEAVSTFIAAFPPDDHNLLRQRLAHLNDPSLRNRLAKLTDTAGDAFTLIVPTPDQWTSAAVKARNNLAHGNTLTAGGPRLRALAETVEHLIEVHLLNQLGIPVDKLATALQGTPRTTWIRNLARRYLEFDDQDPTPPER